jgi:hypothetical protein
LSPAKAFLGFVHGRNGPAQSHRGRERFTLRVTRRTVPIIFSMMLVQASERRYADLERPQPDRFQSVQTFVQIGRVMVD